MNPPSAQPQFLFLLRQPAGTPPPAAELQKIMAEFQAWMDGLRAKHARVSHNGLEPSAGKVLRGPDGLSATDGPYTETHEIIGGYVLLTAKNLDEAVASARACPGLRHKMAVEVRPLITCHG